MVNNELIETLNAIKLDKDTNLKPENLKKGVSLLGIDGTLESGSGVKLFETVEDMQADSTAQEGDLAVVYREEIQNMSADTQTQYITFPETVTLPGAFTGSSFTMLRAVDESVMFEGNVQLNQTSFRFDGWSESGMIRVSYSSDDGITYTRDEFMGDSGDLTNPVDLGTIVHCAMSEEWNNNMGYFMQVGGNVFDGLYQAQSYPALFNMKYNVDIMYNTENSKTELTSDEIQLNAYDAVQLCKDLDDVVDNAGYYTMVVTEIKNNIVSKGVIYPGVVSLYKHTDGTIYTNVSVAESSTSYTVSKIEFDVNNKTTQKTELPIIVLQVGTMYCKCVEPVNTTNNYIYVFNFDKPDKLLVRCTYDNSVYSSRYEQTYETLNRYTLTQNQYTLTSSNQLLPDISAYGKNGSVIGDGSIYDNLDYDNIWNKCGIKSADKNGTLKIYNVDYTQLPPVITYNESEENTSSYVYVNSATTNFPYVIDEEGASKYTTDYYVKLSDNEVMRFESSSGSTKLQKYTLNDGVITISLYDTLSHFTFKTGLYHLVAKYNASDNCIYIINPSNNNFRFYKYNMGTKQLTQLFSNSSLNLNINYCWYDICLENQTIFVYGVYTEFLAITFNGVRTKIEDVALTSFYGTNPLNSYSNTYMLTYNGTESSAKIYNMKTKSYTDIVIDDLKNCQLYDNNDGTATYVLCDDTLYKIQNDEVIKTTTIDKTSLDLILYDNNGAKFSSTSQCTSATNIPIAFNNKIYGRFMYIDTTTDIAYINTQIMKAPIVLYHSKNHICSVGSTVYQFTYVNITEDGTGQYVGFTNAGDTSYSVTQYDTNNIKTKFTLSTSVISPEEYNTALDTSEQILGEGETVNE